MMCGYAVTIEEIRQWYEVRSGDPPGSCALVGYDLLAACQILLYGRPGAINPIHHSRFAPPSKKNAKFHLLCYAFRKRLGAPVSDVLTGRERNLHRMARYWMQGIPYDWAKETKMYTVPDPDYGFSVRNCRALMPQEDIPFALRLCRKADYW
jgi:hypothetical protein